MTFPEPLRERAVNECRPWSSPEPISTGGEARRHVRRGAVIHPLAVRGEGDR